MPSTERKLSYEGEKYVKLTLNYIKEMRLPKTAVHIDKFREQLSSQADIPEDEKGHVMREILIKWGGEYR